MSDEIAHYWNAILATLEQRRLTNERPRQGGVIVPEADAYVLPDRVVFVLDMQRLAGISRETWLTPNLWKQFRAALQGRRTFVSDSGGLAITVAREPSATLGKKLPERILLSEEHLLDKPYQVCLGYTTRYSVTLDIAGEHRAVLIGGTSGGGKTNLMQSIILQLAAKHTPAEVQFAIVDTKLVDFGEDYASLPNLFADIAHTLDEADRLIEQVEAERIRRQMLMAQAGVARWEKYADPEPLPLLVLMVDEAADFARRPAMRTLKEVARKGRAFGISVVVGTQRPSNDVIDAQVKANLPTAISFQTRSDVESRVILGVSGAEKLCRRGMALMFVGGRWETVQTLLVEDGVAHQFIHERVQVEHPALSEVEQQLVTTAVDELGGEFKIAGLYAKHRGKISKRALTALAKQWEARGWLSHRVDATTARRVTNELMRVTSRDTSRDTNLGVVSPPDTRFTVSPDLGETVGVGTDKNEL